MLRKIVSGGQTGVDRAALDAALGCGFPCGGWCPKGRLAEDGVIPPHYPLHETPDTDYAQRTMWNVRDSDGTLVLTWGSPTEGTAFTIDVARSLRKACLVVDLADETGTVEDVWTWIRENDIRVLNIAGPRASKNPGVYAAARVFLEYLLSLRCDAKQGA